MTVKDVVLPLPEDLYVRLEQATREVRTWRQVHALIDETSIKLRNAAAHDESLSRADAQAARAWALGVLQWL